MLRDIDDDYSSHPISVTPLYEAPPPPRGWLTAEERVAVKWAAEVADSLSECGGAGVLPGERCAYKEALSGLLSRNSPPRVRLPPLFNIREQKLVRAALAAAGVEVADE